MPISVLDLVVIGVVLISGVLAMVRGFTREVLAIASWAVAAASAVILFPISASFVVHNIVKQPPILVAVIALGSVFLAALFFAYLITAKLSDFVLDSRVGPLDRTLGFIFGFLRGYLLIVVGFYFFSELVTEKQMPSWALDAKTRPFLTTSVEYGKKLLPSDMGGWLDHARNLADEFKNAPEANGEGSSDGKTPTSLPSKSQ